MADMQLAGKKVLMVIAPDKFRDEELLKPKAILEAAGAHVDIAACQSGVAKGMLGATVNPDLQVKDVVSQNYAAIIIVGGMGSPEYLWEDVQLHKIIREINGGNLPVAAICLSGAVLAKAGVLNGKKATVWADPTAIKVLTDSGAQYVADHNVVDGNIITADGPEAAEKFGHSIVEAISKVASHAGK